MQEFVLLLQKTVIGLFRYFLGNRFIDLIFWDNTQSSAYLSLVTSNNWQLSVLLKSEQRSIQSRSPSVEGAEILMMILNI